MSAERGVRLMAGVVEAVDRYRAKLVLAPDCHLEVIVPDFAIDLIPDAAEWAAARHITLTPVVGPPDGSDAVQVLVFVAGTWATRESS